jgi:hypothetical protein
MESQVADNVIDVSAKTFKAVINGVAFLFNVTVGKQITDRIERNRLFKEELLRATVAERIAVLARDPDNAALRNMISKANDKDKSIYWENIPNAKWDEFAAQAEVYGINFVKTDLSDRDDITQICVYEEDKASLEKIADKLGFSTSFTVDDILTPEQMKEMMDDPAMQEVMDKIMDKEALPEAEVEEARRGLVDEIAYKMVMGRYDGEDFTEGEKLGSPEKTETPSRNFMDTGSEKRENPIALLNKLREEKRAAAQAPSPLIPTPEAAKGKEKR